MHRIPRIELFSFVLFTAFRLSTSLAIYSNVINVNDDDDDGSGGGDDDDECAHWLSLKCESLIRRVADASQDLTAVVYCTLWPIKYDLICIR